MKHILELYHAPWSSVSVSHVILKTEFVLYTDKNLMNPTAVHLPFRVANNNNKRAISPKHL